MSARTDNSESSLVLGFVKDCLDSYRNVVKTDQKKYLKTIDTDLIVTVLRLANLLIEKCSEDDKEIYSQLAD